MNWKINMTQNDEWNIENKCIEIELNDPDDFLKVKETLTRMGVPSFKTNTLYQSCHILHKRGRYFIMHFKEMFLLDGKDANLSEEDIRRRNLIAKLLCEWGLIKIKNLKMVEEEVEMNKIKIIPYSEKNNWTLAAKYSIGKG